MLKNLPGACPSDRKICFLASSNPSRLRERPARNREGGTDRLPKKERSRAIQLGFSVFRIQRAALRDCDEGPAKTATWQVPERGCA